MLETVKKQHILTSGCQIGQLIRNVNSAQKNVSMCSLNEQNHGSCSGPANCIFNYS